MGTVLIDGCVFNSLSSSDCFFEVKLLRIPGARVATVVVSAKYFFRNLLEGGAMSCLQKRTTCRVMMMHGVEIHWRHTFFCIVVSVLVDVLFQESM